MLKLLNGDTDIAYGDIDSSHAPGLALSSGAVSRQGDGFAEDTLVDMLLTNNGDKAPYNGESEYSINTDKAEALGFEFTTLKDWIYELIDHYIEQVKDEA